MICIRRVGVAFFGDANNFIYGTSGKTFGDGPQTSYLEGPKKQKIQGAIKKKCRHY